MTGNLQNMVLVVEGMFLGSPLPKDTTWQRDHREAGSVLSRARAGCAEALDSL